MGIRVECYRASQCRPSVVSIEDAVEDGLFEEGEIPEGHVALAFGLDSVVAIEGSREELDALACRILLAVHPTEGQMIAEWRSLLG